MYWITESVFEEQKRSACDSVNTEISHVLQAIQLDEEYAKGTIRISLGKNNTEAEAEKIADALIKIIT